MDMRTSQMSGLDPPQILPSADPFIDNNSDEQMDQQKVMADQNQPSLDSHAETQSLKARCYSCEYTLCVFIAVLLVSALFLVYDYQAQERQIGDILTTLTKNGIEFNVKREQERVDPIRVNRVLWTFHDTNVPVEQKWFKRRMALLAKRAAEEKGYTMVELTESNWRQQLPEKRANMLSVFVDSLRIEKTHDKAKYADLTPDVAEKIMKQLIMLEILYRNGGVYVDSNVLLTDGLKWLDGIENSPLVNVAGRRRPEIVGFYSPDRSSRPQKEEIEAKEEADKFIVRYPSINSYFLYAVAYSDFIKDMLTQFYQLIQNPSTVGELLRINNITVLSMDASKPMRELFYISSQLIFRNKQHQLSKLNGTSVLAIDYYGLITINQNFGPAKLRFMIGNTPALSLFKRLSYITLAELQQQIGHLHFLVVIDPLPQIIGLFEQSFQENRVLARSFIAEYVLDASFTSSTFELKYNKIPMEINKWEEFPKKVWTYFTGFEEESSLLLQFWVEHVRDRAFKSGFTFTILTEKNLEKHISAEAIKTINEAVKDTNGSMYLKTRSELISLAVLSQAGGVWLQPLTILTENLNWLVQTYEDTKMWNRLSAVPRVMLNFNPRRGGVYDVVYDMHANNSIVGWNLGFYNNFMCSEAKAVLMVDWFGQYLANLKTSPQELSVRFDAAGIRPYQWSTENRGEWLMLDTLKCLLSQKQKQLQSKKSKNSSVGFYGLRGVNGLMGELKLSNYTNFMSEAQSNSLFWRYSQQFLQLVAGKIFYPVKLTDDANYLQELLKNNYKNLSAVIHSNSLFMRYLYRSTLKIVDNHGMLQIQNNAELQPWISLPKIVWVYHSESGDTPLTVQCLNNIQYYSEVSKFEVRLVTASNYDKWLSVVLSKEIAAFLEGLQARALTEKSNLNDHLQNIKQKYILLHLLKEHGGILVYRRTLLLESLNWLNSLERNPFLNRGTKTMPEIFGFFTQGYSSNRGSLKSGRRLVKFPSFDTNFFAAVKEATFLADLIPEFRRVLQEPFKVKQRLSHFSNQAKGLQGKDPYYESFFLACYLTLQGRQKQIDEFHMEILAIDYYSIYAMNSRFYSSRLPYYLDGKVSSESAVQHLGGIALGELQARTGPLRFVTIIPKYEEMNKLVEAIRSNNKSRTILQGSFLHRFVFLNDSSRGVVRNDQKWGRDEKGLEWGELPAKVWYYQPNGIESTPLINQLLALNADLVAEADGFTLGEITDNNVKELMSGPDYAEINKLLQFQVSLIHKPHLYSLAVLVNHGGVFLTSSHLLEGLRWIRDIAKSQRGLIYNRFGQLPDVLMTFNTRMTASNVWEYEEGAQTKVARLLNYSLGFIAAERESNFTRDWLEELMNQIRLEGTSRQLSECDPDIDRLSKFNKGLLVYDALTCTLFKRQKLLKDMAGSNYKEALEHYQLWSMSESNGFDKLEGQLNLEESEELNTFVWDYPRETVEALTGKLGGVLSLTEATLSKFESKIKEWKSAPWGHAESVAESFRQRIKPGLLVNATGEILLNDG